MIVPAHHLFIVAVAITNSIALPSSTSNTTSRTQTTIISTSSNCDSNSINITLLLVEPFSGVLFAKEFSQGCRTFGNSSRSLILNLPTSGCGVSLNEEEKTRRLYYKVTVILQQDKFLRQISDENKLIKCFLPDNSFQVKSLSMERTLKTLIPDMNRRRGRMKQHWNDDSGIGDDYILTDALLASKAWMEILPAEHSKSSYVLKVGEPALLVVKSTLPAGIGWRVVDCIAHDGLGDSSQLLLDQDGCPIDELLLPALLKKPAKAIALMKHQEAVSKFAAFKFPDRDRLHLTCSLQLCRNACPQINCSERDRSSTKENRLGRTLSGESVGDILDRLEVFNSFEVRAPEIDLQEDRISFEANNGKYASPFGNIPGDKTVCVSPSSMALSFCLLGLVLLCAVLMAAWSLIRARRSGSNVPYYPRSLFSSSGGSAFGGSKSLLQESPYMVRHSRNMHSYGRMY